MQYHASIKPRLLIDTTRSLYMAEHRLQRYYCRRQSAHDRALTHGSTPARHRSLDVFLPAQEFMDRSLLFPSQVSGNKQEDRLSQRSQSQCYLMSTIDERAIWCCLIADLLLGDVIGRYSHPFSHVYYRPLVYLYSISLVWRTQSQVASTA